MTDHHDAGQPAAPDRPPDAELYDRLAMPFDVTFRDVRGGVELEYITGEQAVSRLNETLGFLGWSFRVVEHGIHAEADECWALGELRATIGGQTVIRQQFGSQKIKRSRSSGTPLDIGFDLKGAATDALKKCASLIGVGLYLWKKEPPASLGPGGGSAQVGGHPGGGRPGRGDEQLAVDVVVDELGQPICQLDVGGDRCGEPVPTWPARDGRPARDSFWVAEWQIKQSQYGLPLCQAHQYDVKDGRVQPVRWTEQATAAADPEALSCEECGEPLTESRFRDGTTWSPAQLAVFGRRKHSRILCMLHYRESNQAKRRAEEALQQVPF